jgi:hypothetical protein
MFYNNGNYEKDIVRFLGEPYDVSYIGENIVAVTIHEKSVVVFVNVITNTITNTYILAINVLEPISTFSSMCT